MILGHYRLARHYVWSSGAAHATPAGRRGRLLGLNVRRIEVERITRGADPVVKIFGKSKKSSIFKMLLFALRIGLDRLCMSISGCGVVCDGSKY